MIKADEPHQACEQILEKLRDSRKRSKILRSEIVVADRLLQRRLELRGAFAELHRKLGHRPNALHVYFDALLATAAFWNPKKMKEARAHRDELNELNKRISARSKDLAAMLERRSWLHNHSEFSADTYFHVADVIAAAAQGNGLFKLYLLEKLDHLQGQFDLKYWPSLSEFIRNIGTDAAMAKAVANDAITKAATASRKASPADYVRAFRLSIEQNAASSGGWLPTGLKITDESVAALMRCSLDPKSAKEIDGPYVKRVRQSDRQRAKAS